MIDGPSPYRCSKCRHIIAVLAGLVITISWTVYPYVNVFVQSQLISRLFNNIWIDIRSYTVRTGKWPNTLADIYGTNTINHNGIPVLYDAINHELKINCNLDQSSPLYRASSGRLGHESTFVSMSSQRNWDAGKTSNR